MSARRLRLLAQQALREAAHLRVGWALGLAALVLVAGASVLRELNFGLEEARFFKDFAAGTVILFGSAEAILLTVTIVQGGLERGAIGLLFTRGVRRSEWLAACLLAVWVALAGLVLSAQVLLGLLLAWHGHAVPVAELAAAGGMSFLRLALVATFALATCVVSRSPLLATILALGLTLAAQLAPIVAWAAERGRPGGRLAWVLLGRVVPNFAALETGADASRAVAYVAGYAVLYAVLAHLVLSRREF